MADNVLISGAGAAMAAADEVTYSGDSAKVQLLKSVHVLGAEGARTVVGQAHAEDEASADGHAGYAALAVRKATPANTSDTDGDYEFLQMSAGRLWASATIDAALPAGNANIGDVDIASIAAGTNYVGRVRLTDGTNDAVVNSNGGLEITGDLAHDAADGTTFPVKVGMKALAHGTNPTAVAAADRTDWYANRAGVPWVMGGHPNIVTYGMSITTAVTNAVIGPTIGAGLKFVATQLQVTTDNANTVFPSIVVGFGTATTPAFAGTPGTVKILGGHPGVPAGGGFTVGDGSGMIGVGADDEEVRITTVGTVTNMYVILKGYTIES